MNTIIRRENFFIPALILVLLTLGLSVSLQSLLAAWNEPAATPPGSNIDIPIYSSSSVAQTIGGSNGSLGVGGAFTVIGNSSFTGNVGIGTASPAQKLSVVGTIESTSGGFKFPDGSILTSSPATPAGTIIMYGGSTAPSGWFLCDGSAVSRTIYASLFAALGTTYGAGDGSTTFNLPDMRGRVGVGSGQGSGLTNRTMGAKGGEEKHSLTINEMPSHSHVENGAQSGGYFGTMPWLISGGTVAGMSTGAAGGNLSHNVMQPFLVVSYIIKY